MWIYTHYIYITITHTQFSVILKSCVSHAEKAPRHVTMETPSENEDMGIPRYSWGGWFCYRYKEERSASVQTESSHKRRDRGRVREEEKRRGEKASRLRKRTHEEQRGQRKSSHSVWLKGLSYIVIQSRRKQSPVPELERLRLRAGREGLGRHRYWVRLVPGSFGSWQFWSTIQVPVIEPGSSGLCFPLQVLIIKKDDFSKVN